MKNRISITNREKSGTISIRPPEGRTTGFIALLGCALFLVMSYISNHSFDISIDSSNFIFLLLMLFLVIYNLWQFFWLEKIDILNDELKIRKMFGCISFGNDISISLSSIDEISIKKKRYRSKGYYYTLYRLVFFSNGKEVARSMFFSKTDGELLLNSPLKTFINDKEFGEISTPN